MKELFKFYIPSHLGYLDLIHKLTEKIVGELTQDGRIQYHLTLAASEAVTNAIVHGNQENLSKDVVLRFFYDEDQIKIEVEDQGKGFDPSRVRSKAQDENLYRESSRGVFLIQTLMDRVKFLPQTGQGTKIEMIKYLNLKHSKNEKTLALTKNSSYNNH